MMPLARDAYSHYLAGQLAGYRDDWATAANELAEAAAAAPDQPVIAVALARALANAKRDPDALAVLAKARETWPDHPEVWLASGDLLGDSDRAGAIAAYERAIALEPDAEHAYLGLEKLAGLRPDRRRANPARADRPRARIGRRPLSPRAAAQARRDELAGAIGELHVVLEHDPDQIDARLDLARLLRIRGKLDEAVAADAQRVRSRAVSRSTSPRSCSGCSARPTICKARSIC